MPDGEEIHTLESWLESATKISLLVLPEPTMLGAAEQEDTRKKYEASVSAFTSATGRKPASSKEVAEWLSTKIAKLQEVPPVELPKFAEPYAGYRAELQGTLLSAVSIQTKLSALSIQQGAYQKLYEEAFVFMKPQVLEDIKALAAQISDLTAKLQQQNWRVSVLQDSWIAGKTMADVEARYKDYSFTSADRTWLQGHMQNLVVPGAAASATDEELRAAGAALIERPRALPVGLSSLTTEEILRALTTPAMPRIGMTNEELKRILVLGGIAEVDADKLLSLEEQQEDLLQSWKEVNANIEAFKEGSREIAEVEVPWYTWPLLGLMESPLMKGVIWYVEHWDYPRSGWLVQRYINLAERPNAQNLLEFASTLPWLPNAVFYALMPAIMTKAKREKFEAKFAEARAEGANVWMSYGEAWQDIEANWFLKLIAEVSTDPLTYVGFGIFTKIAKPLPLIGRLVKGFETGYVKLWDVLIFDQLKQVGRLAPKTIQMKGLEYSRGLIFEMRKIFIGATKAEPRNLTAEATEMLWKAGLDAYASHGNLQGGVYDLGRIAVEHTTERTITNELITEWARMLHSPIVKKTVDVTPELATHIDSVMDMTLRGSRQAGETADILLTIFKSPKTAANQNLSKTLVESWKASVFKGAERMVTARAGDRTGWQMVIRVARQAEQVYTAESRTLIQLERLKMGMTGQMLNKAYPISRLLWADTVERYLVMPVARGYLAFAAYGFGNIMEGIFKPVFASKAVAPYVPRWLTRWIGGSVLSPTDLFTIMNKGLISVPEIEQFVARPEIWVPLSQARWRTWETASDMLMGRFPEFPQWLPMIGGKRMDLQAWLVEAPGRIGTVQRTDYLNKMFVRMLGEEVDPTTVRSILNIVDRNLSIMPKTGSEMTDRTLREYIKYAALTDPDEVRNMFKAVWNTRDAREIEKVVSTFKRIDPELNEAVINGAVTGEIFDNAGRSIDVWAATAQEATVKRFLKSPHTMVEKYKGFGKQIAEFKPTSLEGLTEELKMFKDFVDVYQSTLRSILKQAQREGRFLKGKPKTKLWNETWESLSEFITTVDDVGTSVAGKVMNDIALFQEAGIIAIPKEEAGILSITKAEQMATWVKAQQQTLNYIRQARVEHMVYRQQRFSATPIEERTDTWWDETYSAIDSFYTTAYNNFLRDLRGSFIPLEAIIYELPARAPVQTIGRPLTGDDLARLYGGSTDDLIYNWVRADINVLLDKDEFIAQVIGEAERMARAAGKKAEQLGWTDARVSELFDQFSRRAMFEPTASPLEPAFREIEEMRQSLWKIYHTKGITGAKEAEMTRWLDNLIVDLRKVKTYNTSGWMIKRQQAMDLAQREYYKDWADYMHPSVLNSTMRSIYPFWCYEVHRWHWIPRAALQHPGMAPMWGAYMDKTDRGYVQLPGTMLSFNMLRGTILMGGFTRLMLRDFPEFQDLFPEVAEPIEFLARFGFYPNVMIMAGINILGISDRRRGAQVWEMTPSFVKTPLALYIGTTDSRPAKVLREMLFPDRYRDYYSLLIGMRESQRKPELELKPFEIWSKMQRGVPLDDDEQKSWNSWLRQAALWGALMEQIGLFRLRPEELTTALKEVQEVIYEITGISPEEQLSLRRKGKRYNDYIRKFVSPANQRLLSQLDAFQIWAGRITPMLPSLDAQETILASEYFSTVRKMRDLSRTEGIYEVDATTGQIDKSRLIARGQELIDADAIKTGNMSVWRIESATKDRSIAVAMKMLGATEPYKRLPKTVEERIKAWEEEGTLPLAFHPAEELLNLWYEIKVERVEEFNLEADQAIIYDDWDTFFALRMAFLLNLKGYREDYIHQLTSEWTPMEKLFFDVWSEHLFPYRRGVATAVRAQFTNEEQALLNEFRVASPDRRTEIRDIVRLDGRMLVASYQDYIKIARQNYRLLNPETDAWLRFFEYTESILTPEAKDFYKKIRRQWKMPA